LKSSVKITAEAVLAQQASIPSRTEAMVFVFMGVLWCVVGLALLTIN
jgi:hypothetical protein